MDRWCARCDLCKGEKGHTATSGWTRTELYSRPFRVIQFDTIDCSQIGDGGAVAAADHGMKHVLTAICCFSRFVWLIPIPDATAESVGRALLENVLLGMGMFPAVLRSDRATAFTGSVLAYSNQQLEIRHVVGSSYHPQSQGDGRKDASNTKGDRTSSGAGEPEYLAGDDAICAMRLAGHPSQVVGRAIAV